jgi:hypothetical protein
MNSETCSICGRPESEHHEFKAGRKPKTCVCDADQWVNPYDIPPVCEKFKGDSNDEYCETCEHDKKCHVD